MKKFLAILLVALVAGCAAPIVKVEGDQVVRDKLAVKLPEAWNRLSYPGQPYEVWTQEGASLDQLRLWAGVQAGKPIMVLPPAPSGQKAARAPTFTGKMTPDQLVSLFEIMYAADGSQVKITRIEPGTFAGAQGVRFEFLVIAKKTDLQVRGLGWAAERNGELYAATYHAPDLAFFKRLAPKAEAVVKTAMFK
ncbi:hypothetical protein [Ramlibacter sp. AN1133]|uniref:hypothetical protein n=1 Tax=Ramlibacter sp. AN1133 TaxID=3133429 RepID=UPI0030BE9CB9